MELVGPLCDLEVKRPTKSTDAYFKIAALDRELNTWHNELPEDLKWDPENIAKGPPSLFLLQYAVISFYSSSYTNRFLARNTTRPSFSYIDLS